MANDLKLINESMYGSSVEQLREAERFILRWANARDLRTDIPLIEILKTLEKDYDNEIWELGFDDPADI